MKQPEPVLCRRSGRKGGRHGNQAGKSGLDFVLGHSHVAHVGRRFVLVPFAEIAPGAQHPVLKKTIAALLAETADRSEVRPWHAA